MGPMGPMGLQGPAGASGISGLEEVGHTGVEQSLSSQAFRTVTAYCPSLKRVLSGGCFNSDPRAYLAGSRSLITTTDSGWQCTWRNVSENPISLSPIAFATCATVP